MRVLPKADGTCPSCYAVIHPEETATVAKPVAAPVKKETKASGRKKLAVKAARSAASPAPAAQSPDQTYAEYSQTALEIWRGSLRVFLLPYFLIGVILGIASIIASRFAWEWVVLDTQVNRPSSLSWVLFWLGIAFVLVLAVVGILKADEWAKIQIREIARTDTGFPDFYRAYRKNYWPKTGMPSGAAYDTFLSIIETK